MDLYVRRLLRWEWVVIVIVGLTYVICESTSQMRTMDDLMQEITREKEAAEKVDKAEIDRIMRDLEAERSEIAASMDVFNAAALRLQTKVIMEKNVALLTQEIVRIADGTLVELSLVKPMTERSVGEYEIVPVNTQFRSTYDGLFKFLDAIESSTLLAGVESFSVKYDPAQSLSCDVQLTVYAVFHVAGLETKAEKAGAV